MIVYTYLHAAGNRVNESYYFLYVFVKLMSPNHDTTLTLMSWQKLNSSVIFKETE